MNGVLTVSPSIRRWEACWLKAASGCLRVIVSENVPNWLVACAALLRRCRVLRLDEVTPWSISTSLLIIHPLKESVKYPLLKGAKPVHTKIKSPCGCPRCAPSKRVILSFWEEKGINQSLVVHRRAAIESYVNVHAPRQTIIIGAAPGRALFEQSTSQRTRNPDTIQRATSARILNGSKLAVR